MIVMSVKTLEINLYDKISELNGLGFKILYRNCKHVLVA